MVGHNANESILYTPQISTDGEFTTYLTQFLKSAPNDTIQHITTVLYPNVLDGTYGYTTQFGRAASLVYDVVYACNTRFLGTAFGEHAHNYRFQYPPATHGQDVSYTFYNGDPNFPDPTLPVNAALAEIMQDYFVQFAIHRDPNNATLPHWPSYAKGSSILTFGANGVGTSVDDVSKTRCDYWQSAPFRG